MSYLSENVRRRENSSRGGHHGSNAKASDRNCLRNRPRQIGRSGGGRDLVGGSSRPARPTFSLRTGGTQETYLLHNSPQERLGARGEKEVLVRPGDAADRTG